MSYKIGLVYLGFSSSIKITLETFYTYSFRSINKNISEFQATLYYKEPSWKSEEVSKSIKIKRKVESLVQKETELQSSEAFIVIVTARQSAIDQVLRTRQWDLSPTLLWKSLGFVGDGDRITEKW